MARLVDVQIDRSSLQAVTEALLTAGEAGRRAQRRALREMGRSARSVAAKEVAGRLAVPQRLIRRRVQVFVRRNRNPNLSGGRLWGGLAAGLKSGEHKSVRKSLRAKYPQGFDLPRRGRVASSWFTRTGRSRYPIVERTLDIDIDVMATSLREGLQGAFRRYPRRLRALYRLERERRRTRRTRRRG